MHDRPDFFDFAAEVGLTKHIGGLEATDALVGLCGIGPGKYVLDVGCGVGVTPCYLAGKYGCRVMGVDINEGMVKRSQERAARAGLLDKVEFKTADAQALPFEDATFDAVITESVTAFPADKQKAVREYARVIKPGGFVGLNESTWLKSPPPPEMAEWASREIGANVQPLTPEGWMSLLEKAGLKEIVTTTHDIQLKAESKGILQRYGCSGALGIFARMLLLYIKNPEYREFVKKVQKQGVTPANLDEYFGYGLYVGKK